MFNLVPNATVHDTASAMLNVINSNDAAVRIFATDSSDTGFLWKEVTAGGNFSTPLTGKGLKVFVFDDDHIAEPHCSAAVSAPHIAVILCRVAVGSNHPTHHSPLPHAPNS